MRARNFFPLALYVVFSAPLGALFLFAWQGHILPILFMQTVHALLLIAVYRASVRSARKNFTARPVLEKIVYLPLKLNLALYFLFGIPLVLVFAQNLAVLLVGYAVQILGFSFTCYSGLLYVSRSQPGA